MPPRRKRTHPLAACGADKSLYNKSTASSADWGVEITLGNSMDFLICLTTWSFLAERLGAWHTSRRGFHPEASPWAWLDTLIPSAKGFFCRGPTQSAEPGSMASKAGSGAAQGGRGVCTKPRS